ncbi:MAG: hypothetical protein U0531_01000 [Dehalococcoidia bacterium]
MAQTHRSRSPFVFSPFLVAGMPAFGVLPQTLGLNADRTFLDISAAAAGEQVRVVTESTER